MGLTWLVPFMLRMKLCLYYGLLALAYILVNPLCEIFHFLMSSLLHLPSNRLWFSFTQKFKVNPCHPSHEISCPKPHVFMSCA